MEDKWTQYAFFSYPAVGRRTKQRLLLNHSEEEILSWSEVAWEEHLTLREWNYYQKKKDAYNIEETRYQWDKIQKKSIEFLYHKEERFPEKLKQIPDIPLGLFVLGEVPKKEKTIAIVGARNPTAYGKEMAHYFAKELSDQGVSVISGLAFGIDVTAHQGALQGYGKTYGILGCGIDVIYPRENYSVFEQIQRQGGILSEYGPGTPPDRFRFPERNRLISGLSDGVLVVEARKKSGSLITADCALEQGKDVFALPGRVLDPLSEGTNWLLREGAKVVTDPEHILEELFPLCEKKEKEIRKSEKLLDCKEKIVYDCLSLDPKTVEEIIYETNLSASEGISILFRLELKGYVKKIANQHYIVNVQTPKKEV